MSTDNPRSRGQVMFVESIRPGDQIATGGRFQVVTTVRRAQGRKPSVGENLHLITDRGVVKANSTAPIRVRRAGAASH